MYVPRAWTTSEGFKFQDMKIRMNDYTSIHTCNSIYPCEVCVCGGGGGCVHVCVRACALLLFILCTYTFDFMWITSIVHEICYKI